MADILRRLFQPQYRAPTMTDREIALAHHAEWMQFARRKLHHSELQDYEITHTAPLWEIQDATNRLRARLHR